MSDRLRVKAKEMKRLRKIPSTLMDWDKMNDCFVLTQSNNFSTNLVTVEKWPSLYSLLFQSFFVDNPRLGSPFGVSPDFCFSWGSLTEETDSRSSLLWPQSQMRSVCLHLYCTQISAPASTDILVSCNDLLRFRLYSTAQMPLSDPKVRLDFCRQILKRLIDLRHI